MDQNRSEKSLPALTLVLGGGASGKSKYAESCIQATDQKRIYIATAQAFDEEMKAKIAAHKIQRGPNWTTIECPIDLCGAISGCEPDDVVLVDCLTLWLTNVLLAEKDLDAEMDALVASLSSASATIVAVSNEVGQGIVPDNALSRQFRAAQGRLNQKVAEQADTVVGVMAGLPFALKGSLPL